MHQPLSKREGLMLFWCEGDKPRDNLRKVQVTNANPALLRDFTVWLESFYGVPRESLRLRLHLWMGSDENEAKKAWSESLQIPIENFTKTWFKPRGMKNTHPHGICRVSVSSKAIMQQIRTDVEEEFQYVL